MGKRREKEVGFGFTTFLAFVALIIVIICGVFVIRKDDDASKENFPVMEIGLNGVTLAEVQENGKEVKYQGNTVSIDGKTYKDVEFKGRGNFSWAAEKKSYRIKFSNKVSLLGMEKSRKWALIANSVDDSLMRNDLAFYLMDLITDDEYPFRGEFVKLKVDGEELGLYYLIQTMSIGKKAVDLTDPMGVLVEFDNAYCETEEKRYMTKAGDCLTLKQAVADDNVDVAMLDFGKDFDALEKAIEKGDFETVGELIDLESFAEYFLISELTANPDAYVTSWFMHSDGLEDKIHAGLAWDYDAAFGNREWGKDIWSKEFYDPKNEMVREKYIINEEASASNALIKASQIMYKLMEDADFREIVVSIYREKLMGNEEKIIQYISERADEIEKVANDDAKLWNKGDFEEEVEYLKWWVTERMKYFEEKYEVFQDLAARRLDRI